MPKRKPLKNIKLRGETQNTAENLPTSASQEQICKGLQKRKADGPSGNTRKKRAQVMVDPTTSLDPTIQRAIEKISDFCTQRLKQVLHVATQFQRHCRRKQLLESDVAKALTYFDDIVKDRDDIWSNSERTLAPEMTDETCSLSCRGRWLSMEYRVN